VAADQIGDQTRAREVERAAGCGCVVGELFRVRVGRLGRPLRLYMEGGQCGLGQRATAKRAVGAAMVPAWRPCRPPCRSLGRAVPVPCHGPGRRPMHCTGLRAVPGPCQKVVSWAVLLAHGPFGNL
jgi:hypothetical protein